MAHCIFIYIFFRVVYSIGRRACLREHVYWFTYHITFLLKGEVPPETQPWLVTSDSWVLTSQLRQTIWFSRVSPLPWKTGCKLQRSCGTLPQTSWECGRVKVGLLPLVEVCSLVLLKLWPCWLCSEPRPFKIILVQSEFTFYPQGPVPWDSVVLVYLDVWAWLHITDLQIIPHARCHG